MRIESHLFRRHEKWFHLPSNHLSLWQYIIRENRHTHTHMWRSLSKSSLTPSRTVVRLSRKKKQKFLIDIDRLCLLICQWKWDMWDWTYLMWIHSRPIIIKYPCVKTNVDLFKSCLHLLLNLWFFKDLSTKEKRMKKKKKKTTSNSVQNLSSTKETNYFQLM